jgi:hypothetical protein
MNPSDDELRAAAGPLADESFPDGMLDEALGAAPRSGDGRVLAGGAAAVFAALIAVGIGFAALGPAPADEPVTTVTPSPSPPAGSAVTRVAELNGVRLTVTLDPSRALDGEVVFATTTAENIGTESRYWSMTQEGDCDWSTHLVIEPVVPLNRGRVWPSEELQNLKFSLMDIPVDLDGEIILLPDYFVASDRLAGLSNSCYAINRRGEELGPGEVRTDVLAWRAEGPLGMPLQPGTYLVNATFSAFGGPDGPSLSIPIEVVGPDVDYLDPGEAMDVVLSNAEFVDLYRAARAREPGFRESTFEFIDERWVVTLEIGDQFMSAPSDYTLVADVDAITGEIDVSTTDADPAVDMAPEEAFAVPNECENPTAGYRISMPGDWVSNTAVEGLAACQWFAPTSFPVTDASTIPPEVGIVLRVLEGSSFAVDQEVFSRREYTVDGLPAVRWELTSPSTIMWIIGLDGELPEEGVDGAWLIASTNPDCPPECSDNRSWLDRMIATLQVDRP